MLINIALFLGTPLVTLISYLGAHAALRSGFTDDTMEVASSIAFRIAALHGLVISLVFAGGVQSYQHLRHTVTTEAINVAELYDNMKLYGLEEDSPELSDFRDYVWAATTLEWDKLREEGALSDNVWDMHRAIYSSVLALAPNNVSEQELKTAMISQLQSISNSRYQREFSKLIQLPTVFWLAAIGGLVLVSFSFCVYKPGATNLTLLALYGLYAGLMLSAIHALTTPYVWPVQLSADDYAIIAGK